MLAGLRRSALLQQHDPQIEVRLGVIGLGGQGLAIMLLGLVVFVLRQSRFARLKCATALAGSASIAAR